MVANWDGQLLSILNPFGVSACQSVSLTLNEKIKKNEDYTIAPLFQYTRNLALNNVISMSVYPKYRPA